MIDTFYLTGITNWWTCQYSHHESVSRYLIFFLGRTRGVMVLCTEAFRQYQGRHGTELVNNEMNIYKNDMLKMIFNLYFQQE